MSKRTLATCLAAMLALGVTATAGTIHDGLEQVLASKAPHEKVSTLVFLQEQADIDGLTADLDARHATRQQRHEQVVRTLQELARATQVDLLAHLKTLQAAGRAESFEPFWVANVVRVDAPASEIQQLAQRPEVGTVYFNYQVNLTKPMDVRAAPAQMDSPEPGLVAIRAPEVWALGYTGVGALVANMDTGVDGNHPALASRWAGVADPRYAGHPEWAWHDGLADPPTTFPSDGYGHGTHTMGTVCGGAPGDQVGVAPGAIWMADNCINQGVGPEFEADVIRGYQWMADPDGNPGTVWDVPAVCSNSWGVNDWIGGYPPCDDTFWVYLDNCEAAGTVILFSAGNEGSSGLRRPADRATDDYRTCAVAAVDANTPGWPIAGFSSRGPTYCTPNHTAAIKPDIAAPGVHVRSAWPGNGYNYSDGTSMASPHVNGVVALMFEACPELTVEEYKQIIYDTAVDLGAPGEDNDYGWGMIDAYEAVQMAIDMCGPHPPRVTDGLFETPVNTPASVQLQATDDGLPDPPGQMTFIIVSLPDHGRLSDPNAGDIQSVPYTLVNNANEVTYTPNTYYKGTDAFTWKANDGGVPPEGGDSDIATVSGVIGGPEAVHVFSLDSDPGWTVEADWAFGQPTGQGGQYGGPDPTSGHTGQNVYGYNLNGDYPNSMPEYDLTTTAIDCGDLTQVSLRFWRWLGVERSQYDHAYVRVSNDGASWHEVWQNPDEETADGDWVAQEFDISDYADNQPAVYVRWTMGTTDTGWRYCGWNIDDIEIWALAPLPYVTGDVNCDGEVDFADINPFVLLMTDPAGWQAQYPDCPLLNGDINGDGKLDFGDINPFVRLLAGP